MTPMEAADKIRDTFQLDALSPQDLRRMRFVADVASELGIEPTPHALEQLATALHAAGCDPDPNDFPKMMFSKTYSKNAHAIHDARRQIWHVTVHNQKELEALGAGWVEDADSLDNPDAPKMVERSEA